MIRKSKLPAWLWVLVLSFLVAFLGVWPHIRFSVENGKMLYYKSAYDEEYYTSATPSSGRQASGYTIKALAMAMGDDLPAATIVADAVIPFMAALAAFFLASGIVTSIEGQLLLSLFFLFGESFINQGSMHFWPPEGTRIVEQLMQWSTVFSIHSTSFFSIYRTPEPQTSFIWCFLVLGCLVRLGKPAKGTRSLIALAGLNTLSPFFYMPCTLPTLMVQALWCLLLYYKKQTRYLTYRILTALAFATVAFLLLRLLSAPAEGASAQITFSSRLPLITLSVLLSLALTVLQGARLLRSHGTAPDPLDLLSLTCCAMPMILLNQQLVTGRMVMVTPFEISINAILLFLGAALLILQGMRSENSRPRRRFWLIQGALVSCLLVIVWAQDRSYRMWHEYNQQVQAAVRAIDHTVPPGSKQKIWIDSSDFALLMSIAFLRPQVQPVCLYSQLFGSGFLASIGTDGFVPPQDNVMAPFVFEHWLRNGITPPAIEKILYKQASDGAGLDINFFFSMLDSWKPFSMGRTVKRAEMQEWIPKIVERYSTFYNECQQQIRTVLLLSPTELTDQTLPCLDVTFVSKTTVGEASIFTYMQKHKLSSQQ